MTLRDAFFATLVALLWGGNFVSAKFGVAHFGPFFLTALRFIFVALLLVWFVPKPSREQTMLMIKLSTVLGVLHFALLFAAMYHGLGVASCAVVAQLGVPFSCLMGAFFMNDKIGPWRMAGLVIAFGGMVIVAGTPNILAHPLGFGIALAAAFFWGIANILMKRLGNIQIFQMLAWLSVFAAPQLLVISLLFESNQWQALLTVTQSAALSVAYTVFGSTLAGYGLWYYLLKKHAVSQVAPFSLLTPVFGIAFGQLFFSETLSWQVLVGGGITIAGVAIIVVRRPALAMVDRNM